MMLGSDRTIKYELQTSVEVIDGEVWYLARHLTSMHGDGSTLYVHGPVFRSRVSRQRATAYALRALADFLAGAE